MYSLLGGLLLLLIHIDGALLNKSLDILNSTKSGILPHTDHCDTSGHWEAYAFLVEDCFAAIQQLYIHDTLRHADETFEFLARGARPRTQYPKVRLPGIYQISSCTLAIVMLDDFKPSALPGGASFTTGASDTASFGSIWKAAKRVEDQCLLASRKPGWQPVGTKSAIGVFLWATDSDINHQVTGFLEGISGPPSLSVNNASNRGLSEG
ncbi:hypothetical protein ACLMJK_002250 [Lecanora helva]